MKVLERELSANPHDKNLTVKMQYYVKPTMFAFKNIQETMRFVTLKIHQIIDKDYPCARKATTSFFAIKTSSELHQFASKSQKQNHCIRISETYFCKSRFSSYIENSSSSNLVTSLLKQSGFRQHNWLHYTWMYLPSSITYGRILILPYMRSLSTF